MNTYRRTLFSILLALFISTFGVFFIQQHVSPTPVDTALAVSTDNLSGWAWGGDIDSGQIGGIGWISFNCTDQAWCGTSNYGVQVDETQRITQGVGAFSGYAWAGNKDETSTAVPPPVTFGWITFNRSIAGTPPAGQGDPGAGVYGSPLAYIDWKTGKVYGWARVLAGCQDILAPATSCTRSSAGALTGGWDGWIKLSDFSSTKPYGVKLNLTSYNFSGYAWGGADVVGWIDFNPATGGGVKFTRLYNPPASGCGSAAGMTFAPSGPIAYLCTDGTLPAVVNNAAVLPNTPAYWSWTCISAGVSCTASQTQCSDGIDNNGNGKIDSLDPGCNNSSGVYDPTKPSERNFQFKEF